MSRSPWGLRQGWGSGVAGRARGGLARRGGYGSARWGEGVAVRHGEAVPSLALCAGLTWRCPACAGLKGGPRQPSCHSVAGEGGGDPLRRLAFGRPVSRAWRAGAQEGQGWEGRPGVGPGELGGNGGRALWFPSLQGVRGDASEPRFQDSRGGNSSSIHRVAGVTQTMSPPSGAPLSRAGLVAVDRAE